MIRFSWRYLRHFSLETVFPSWTVLYVGIAIAGLTAPFSQQFLIGQLTVLYGFLATCLVLPVIVKRLKQYPLSEVLKPNTATICAPFSLVTAAYAVTYQHPNAIIMGVFITLAQIAYAVIIVQLPKLVKRPFSPVFSALTFPLVISATALKNSLTVLPDLGFLSWLLWAEITLAAVVVASVFVGYIRYFVKK